MEHQSAFSVLIVGVLVLSSSLLHIGFRRAGLPPLVGYISVGVALRSLDIAVPFLDGGTESTLATVGEIGIAVLLFKVGLETDVRGLLGQLHRATWIWIGNVVVSGGLGYGAARLLLDLDLVPSLFVAAALSATSVGISIAAWRDAGVLRSRTGELLIDVAELDDISGVVFAAVLFAVAPILIGASSGGLLVTVGLALGSLLLKGGLFGGACYLFSRHVERRLTLRLTSVARGPELIEVVLALGLIIAAVAGALGFSVAIGSLFAGVLFSRDPEVVREEGSFSVVYDLFSPFFFIGIGLSIDPRVVFDATSVGLVLLGAGIAGKLLGTWIPGRFLVGDRVALLLGVSLVPRAEIALVIMRQGEQLGAWAVPAVLYAGIVLVSAVTCLATPFAVRVALKGVAIEVDEELQAPRR